MATASEQRHEAQLVESESLRHSDSRTSGLHDVLSTTANVMDTWCVHAA